MHTAVERETKLDADLDFTLPDLREVVPQCLVLQPQDLRSLYFDSVDLRLWGAGTTLRHRRGEDPGSGIWTLKLPIATSASGITRSELTWSGASSTIPTEAIDILLGVLRREPLRIAAELHCTRRRVLLRDDAGRQFAEIDDDSVVVRGGPRDGLRFHEVELEAEVVDDRTATVLRMLQEAGAKRGANGPKIGRAFDRPRGESDTDDGRSPSMGQAISLEISRLLQRLVANDLHLRIEAGHPPTEAIHHGRVAARRLRSILGTVGDVLDPVWLEHTKSDLRWLGSALGEVRDCDVLAEGFATARADGAVDPEGQSVLMACLRREREDAGRGVSQVLISDRYLDLLDRLHAAITRLAFSEPTEADQPANRALPPLVGAEWRSLRRAVRRARRRPTDRRLHKARIHAKKVRYASEFAAPYGGKSARSTAKAAKRLQTLLGDHQDAVMAERWLRHQVECAPRIAGFAAGQLAALQRTRRGDVRDRWTSRWKRLDRPKRRNWMSV